MANIGAAIGKFLGFDPTPGFNITKSVYNSPTSGPSVVPGIEFNGGKKPTPPPAPKPVVTSYRGPGGQQSAASSASYSTGGGSYAGGSGGGGGGGSTGPDLNAIRRNLAVSQGGFKNEGHQSAKDVGNKYRGDVLSFLGNIEGQQDTINSGEVNNSLNLRRAMSAIASSIRTGLRSAGVSLANMNAGDSGAADAAARAYATSGNKQVGDANNEAAITDQELMQKQGLLDRQKGEGLTGFDRYRDAEVSRIRNDLSSKLQQLDATAQAQGVGGAVDMGIVSQVVDDAITQLASVDSEKNARLGNIRHIGDDDANAKAAAMDALGAETGSAFTAGQDGISLQGQDTLTGAPISQLPLISRKKAPEQQLVAA